MVTLVMFYPHVPHKPIQFKGEAEYVVMITAVPHHKATIWLSTQDPLCCLTRQGTPVPTMLRENNI